MSKEPFEYVDITLLNQLEGKLLEREEKVQSKVYRVCQRCKVRKPLFQFTTDKRNLNGRTSICKKCRIIEYLRYYYQNRARILILHKKYRDDHKGVRTKYYQDYQRENKEKLQKSASEWYQANKKAIKKRNLEYYNANREVCNERRGLWIENNKEKIKKYNREYKRTHK